MAIDLALKVTNDVLKSVDNYEFHPFNEQFYSMLVNMYTRQYNKAKALEY